MLDISHIPSAKSDTQIFYANGTTGWQTWVKPRNAKFIQIFCLGAGGGGGAGGYTSTTRGGGGGGSAGGNSKAIYPALLLPDNLYILVGVGGAGGVGGTTGNGAAGSTGGISYVAIAPQTTATTLLLASSNVAAPAGGGGAGTAAGGGTAAAAWVTTSSPFTTIGLLTLSTGVAGAAGGSPGLAGSNATALASNIVMGGAGGGGISTTVRADGGNISPASILLTSTVSGGLAGNGTNGEPGRVGYGLLNPICGTGGSGGGAASGSAPLQVGGRGGDGWYGCGGGGAGASPTGSNVTNIGGRGGDGLVIITTIF